MELRELIQGIGTVEVEGSLDRQVAGVTCDARRVMPGMIYVALRNDHADVQMQIELALSRGAIAVVCQEKSIVRQRATKIGVRDARVASMHIAKHFYSNPSAGLRLLAVIGNTGQSQTAFALKQLLEGAGIRTGLISTERYEIGERRLPAGRLFPDHCELQDFLGQMVRAGCGACVIELNREQLLEQRLDGVDLDAVIFTETDLSAGLDHEEQATFFRALSSMGSSEKQPCAVIKLDDLAAERFSRKAPMKVKLTYGLSDEAGVRAANISLGQRESAFTIETENGTFDCRSSLIGLHNIYHVLAAAGGALALGLPAETIRAALRNVRPLPGNLELVSDPEVVPVYVDSARTPDAVWQLLKSVKAITPGRVLLVFGCPERSTARFRYEMGKIAAQWSDYIVLTSDNPGREPLSEICNVIAQGIEQNRPAHFEVKADRALAIYRAISMALPGDAVIISGKGERTYQELADTVVPFDDRECARECLQTIAEDVPVRTPSLLSVRDAVPEEVFN
jgi:UDP-N-acetylmuramoyl-L-alanyl-D-glutamate--2,6-diaminopimelate ligase